MIRLQINDKFLLVPKNSSVLEACKLAGIDIPRFCYHETLSIAGNCRMCLVEIEKSPKPVASCAMPVANNMIIYTNTPLVKKARENVIETLLLNHPLDCPICDQGGECDLQDQTQLFGSDISRMYTKKRSVNDKQYGPLIKTIMTRCIHCTRCVRFSTEIAGINSFGTLNRGGNTEIGAYIQNLSQSEISGNVIDLCPVGALTSKPYAFLSRPWELKKIHTIDPFDSAGSNINIELKESEIIRILPKYNKHINNEWISDKIRFSYDGVKRSRINFFYKWENKHFTKIDIYQLFKFLKTLATKKPKILIPINLNIDNTSLNMLNQLKNLSTIRIKKIINSKKNFNLVQSFNSINKSDFCLLLGANTKLENPILHIRLRETIINKNLLVYNYSSYYPTNIPVIYSSLKLTEFIKCIEGKTVLQQLMCIFNAPVIIASSKFAHIIDTIEAQINKINKKVNVFFIGSESNLNGVSLFNFDKLTQKDLLWADFILGINLDTNFYTNKIINNKKIIWANTHGSKLAEKAILIIPTLTFLETKFSFFNGSGMFQKTQKIITAVNSKLSLISLYTHLFFSVKKKFYTFFVNKKILKQFEMYKYLTYINKHTLSSFNINKLVLSDYPLKSNLEDYYLSHTFLKASEIMGKCSTLLRKQATNFN